MNRIWMLFSVCLATLIFSSEIAFCESSDSINERIKQEKFLCVTTPEGPRYNDLWIDVEGEKDFAVVNPYITVFFSPSKDIDDNTRIRSNFPDDDYEIVVGKKDFEPETYFYGIEKLNLYVSDIKKEQIVIEKEKERAFFSEQLENKNENINIDVTKAEIVFDKEYRPIKLSLFYNYIKDGIETRGMVRKYKIDYLSEKKFHQEYFVQRMPDIFYYIFGTFFRLGMIQGVISIVLFLLVVISIFWFLVKMKRRVSKTKKNRK